MDRIGKTYKAVIPTRIGDVWIHGTVFKEYINSVALFVDGCLGESVRNAVGEMPDAQLWRKECNYMNHRVVVAKKHLKRYNDVSMIA